MNAARSIKHEIEKEQGRSICQMTYLLTAQKKRKKRVRDQAFKVAIPRSPSEEQAAEWEIF
jgi:hypothetical protein